MHLYSEESWIKAWGISHAEHIDCSGPTLAGTQQAWIDSSCSVPRYTKRLMQIHVYSGVLHSLLEIHLLPLGVVLWRFDFDLYDLYRMLGEK